MNTLERIDLSILKAEGFAYLEELAYHLARAGAQLQEIPITFRERQRGQSKVSWREAIGKIATIGRLMFTR